MPGTCYSVSCEYHWPRRDRSSSQATAQPQAVEVNKRQLPSLFQASSSPERPESLAPIGGYLDRGSHAYFSQMLHQTLAAALLTPALCAQVVDGRVINVATGAGISGVAITLTATTAPQVQVLPPAPSVRSQMGAWIGVVAGRVLST
jgi:hypothetical protein